MKLNLPNKLSIIRICLIPVFTAVFYIPQIPYRFLISAIIFVVAACTDFLDGYIARKYNMVTNLGKFLDPIADKVLVSVAMILLIALKNELFTQFGVAQTAIFITTAVSSCVIMARELIISAFRQIAAANNVILAAEKLGKFKTVFQDACIVVLLVSAGVAGVAGEIISYVGLVLFAIATVLTVVSGVSYVVKNKQVLEDA